MPCLLPGMMTDEGMFTSFLIKKYREYSNG